MGILKYYKMAELMEQRLWRKIKIYILCWEQSQLRKITKFFNSVKINVYVCVCVDMLTSQQLQANKSEKCRKAFQSTNVDETLDIEVQDWRDKGYMDPYKDNCSLVEYGRAWRKNVFPCSNSEFVFHVYSEFEGKNFNPSSHFHKKFLS